ncbi:MAG TPA: GNVR domain-containing protein [Gemmatimonadaceae bacterium]
MLSNPQAPGNTIREPGQLQQGASGYTGTVDTSPISPLAFAALVLRNSRTLIVCSFVGAVVGLAAGVLVKRTYTAGTSFMPQERRNLSQLSGLAAQFGLAVPNGESGFSAAVYADLSKSDDVLGRIVSAQYPTLNGDSTTLTQLLKAKGKTPEIRRAEAVREMKKHIVSASNSRTGVVTLNVTLTDPLVAKSVAQRVIADLVRFNVETRQSQASAERRFTERRLTEAKDSLSEAESRLRAFLKSNRGDFRGSPDLSLEQDRLSRKVTMEQQIYTTLAQAYEQAKIEEVRDTPVITVLQPAEQPALPNSRRTVVKTAIGLFLGFAFSAVFVLLRATFRRRRLAGEQDVEELSAVWRDLRSFKSFGRSARRKADPSLRS